MSGLDIEVFGPAHGRDLALIPGWGLGKAAWQPVAGLLAESFRVHLVDLPGYGGTPASAAGFVDSARALVAALPAGAIYCGWSLGSLLALQAAQLAPERVGALVLVGATPSFTQRADWPNAQPPELLASFAAAIAADAGTALPRFVALFNQGDTQARAIGRTLNKTLQAGPPADVLQRFIALLNQGDVQAKAINRSMSQQLLAAPLPDTVTLLAGLDWLRDVDLRPALAGSRAPALLVHGENDPLMPLAAARWLNAALPGSHLEIFAGAAHAPFLNNPELFARLIGDHFHAPAPDQAARPRVV